MLTVLWEFWSTDPCAWVNSERYTYTYDANGNMLTELEEEWQTNAWVNSWRYTYTYDANGNSITGKYERWQGNWQPYTYYLPLYSNKNEIYHVYAYRYQASYRAFTSGIPEIAANSSIIVYPNPANTSFEITTDNKQIIKKIEIYSIEGKLINEQNFTENNVKVNSSQLPTGLYIIKVQTNKEQFCKKLLISHQQ